MSPAKPSPPATPAAGGDTAAAHPRPRPDRPAGADAGLLVPAADGTDAAQAEVDVPAADVEMDVDGDVLIKDPKEFSGAAASRSVRWSGIAIIGKQAFQLLCALTLARILGPHSYGVISEAMIYVTITQLLLDQGMSSALIQRKDLSRYAPGAAATMNLATGAVFGVLTWYFAPQIAHFLHTKQLVGVLHVLAVGLILKAAAVTPRAMLQRGLKFKQIATADIAGSAIGAVAGITAAVLGASYNSVLFQILVMDLIVAVLMQVALSGSTLPNLHLRELGVLIPFGAKVFGTRAMSYCSRNTDNVLVGRYLGATSLSYYAMAYRVLAIPVQMLGQTVNRVLFPVFARLADRPAEVGRRLLVSTELLAIVTLPAMSLLSAASWDLVYVGLGHKWLPTVPLMIVLALAGARETIVYITPSLILGLGRADLNLRFELFSTGMQVTGIVIGLQYGVFGVALGYALAGSCVTPVMWLIQKHLTGITVRRQLLALWPAAHASAWAAATYVGIHYGFRSVGLPSVLALLVGIPAFVGVYVAVLKTFHARAARESFGRLAKLRPGTRHVPRHAAATP